MLIFTDASHSNKPKMSGLGSVIIDRKAEFEFGVYTPKCDDNNVAEVAAIAMAIQYAHDKYLFKNSPDKTVTIITDSTYAVQRIMQNTPGKDDFEEGCLQYIRNYMRNSNKKFNLMQIKGHVHDGTKFAYYNNIADNIAGEYRKLGLYKIQERVNKQIHKHKNNYNR